jgi:hypothetical protein
MSSIDDAFFEAYERHFSTHVAVRTERTPEDMVVRELDVGWIEWRLLPGGRAVREVLDEVERVSGLCLPPSFRRWYGSRHTLSMDIGLVRLPANPSNDPGRPLLDRLATRSGLASAARPLELGLTPFGEEAHMDAGPLCFDRRRGGDPDAWPITYWDHDFVGSEREIGPILFSSFDRLLIACTAYLQRFVEAREREEGRLNEHLPEILEALLDADPEGAGGPGREYWKVLLIPRWR